MRGEIVFLSTFDKKNAFFLILGDPCFIIRVVFPCWDISSFSASNFVPYTGGGLYTIEVGKSKMSAKTCSGQMIVLKYTLSPI